MSGVAWGAGSVSPGLRDEERLPRGAQVGQVGRTFLHRRSRAPTTLALRSTLEPSRSSHGGGLSLPHGPAGRQHAAPYTRCRGPRGPQAAAPLLQGRARAGAARPHQAPRRGPEQPAPPAATALSDADAAGAGGRDRGHPDLGRLLRVRPLPPDSVALAGRALSARLQPAGHVGCLLPAALLPSAAGAGPGKHRWDSLPPRALSHTQQLAVADRPACCSQA